MSRNGKESLMSQPNPDPLKQAQEFLRTGQVPKAQRLLVDYVRQNPNSEQGWYLLSQAVTDPKRRIDCLQRVLRLNPANVEAQQQLVKAMTAATAPKAPAPEPVTPSAPVLAPVEPVESKLPPAPVFTAPKPAPSMKPIAKPVEPEPAPQPVTVAEPEADLSQQDAGLFGLRTQMQSSAEAIEKRSRRRKPLRIIMLLLLLVLAISLGVYFFVLRPMSNRVAAPAVVMVTPSPTITPTPSRTPVPSPTPTLYPPTWTPTPLPTAIPTRTPTPIPPLSGQFETILNQVQDQVAQVRGLKFEAYVPRALIDRNQFESELKAVLNLPDVLSALPNQTREFSALGLVSPTYDLTHYFFNSFADNLGGFYVPWLKALYVTGDTVGVNERLIFSHEIGHALLDQHFHTDDLGVYPQCTMDGQRCQAIRALIEGDARLITEQWLKDQTTKQDKQDLASFQPPSLAVPEQFAPSFIELDVSFPYTVGLSFVKSLYDHGGWAEVNQAYTNLPLSTEQILHPEKYRAGEKPIPVAAVPLTQTLGPGWQLVANDVLGEWRTYLMLSAGVDEASRLSEDVAREAAAGWGGDRVQVYYKPDADQTVMTAEWVWDTPQDAAEFNTALTTYLDQRFRGAQIEQPGRQCWSLNYQVACLFTPADNQTLWLLAPDLQTLDVVGTDYGVH